MGGKSRKGTRISKRTIRKLKKQIDFTKGLSKKDKPTPSPA
jgi:hypothetical protein